MDALPINDVLASPEYQQLRDETETKSPSPIAPRFSSGAMNPGADRKTAVMNLPKAGARQPYTARIIFKVRGRILFLPVTEIRWIGAEENYVRICTEREAHLMRETMTAMEQKLDPRLFLRVHRSAIVNLRFVREVRTEGPGDVAVYLASGQRVAMSRSYHARLGHLLTRNAGRVA